MPLALTIGTERELRWSGKGGEDGLGELTPPGARSAVAVLRYNLGDIVKGDFERVTRDRRER